MTELEKNIAANLRAFKDRYLVLAALLLTRMGAKPNYVTFTGIICMIGFVLVVPVDLRLSVLFLAAALTCDCLDGVLARYQNRASDRGKFIDVMTDEINAFLFVLGLAVGQLADILLLIPFVYFMLLSRVLRVLIYSYEFRSDWLFRPVAGFLHNVVVFSGYLSFVVLVFVDSAGIRDTGGTGMAFLNYYVGAGLLVLFFDCLRRFGRILDMKKNRPEEESL
jgi:phosphatidylglycerophosphate synthase